MKTKTKSHLETKVASFVAGEDLGCGDYVALLNQSVDVPSYMWDGCDTSLSPHELVTLKLIPADAGHPLKVIAVCLPFVYVKTPNGKTVTVDTRQIHLVRLDRKCAKVVWKKIRSKGKRKNR